MKYVLLLACAVCGVALAQGSDIPPRVDVVTECNVVTLVAVTDNGRTERYTTANTPRALLDSMASRAPSALWVSAGCKR